MQREPSKERDECWSVYRFISCYSIKQAQMVFFFNVYDNTTEAIKQRIEHTYYMIYGSIQNVLTIGITGRKIEDQINQIAYFYQGDLVKERMKSPLKVSDVMINARVITIDIVILLFHGIYLSGKKLPLSVALVLLQSFLNMHTTNIIRKSSFTH